MGKDFNVDKLKGSENYHTWKFAIEQVLAYKDLDKCINEPQTGVTITDKQAKEAKAILSLSVETQIFVHITGCTDALAIWKALKKLYEDRGLTRKIGLLRNLISTRLEDCENMQQYVDVIKNYASKLTGVGFSIPDEWLGAILLAGLTDEYRPFIMSLEASDAVADIKAEVIITRLLDSQPNGSVQALIAKKNSKGKTGKKQLKCFNCGSKDHFAKACT